MKKLFLGLTAAVIVITGIFTFAGCEKEELVSQKSNSIQLAFSQNSSFPDEINIAALSDLPEMHEFVHLVSQQLATFAFNVESNDEFTNQVNEICDNISNADNQDDINLYYSMLSQMVFPIDELNIISTGSNGLQYRPDNCISQLNTAYNNLDSALNETLPGYEEMSEELKMQILARMFEQSLIDNGYVCGGPLEEERDDKIRRATIAYGIAMREINNPFIFAAATTLYCREIKAAWREYWKKGGKEPKGISCKICDL